MLSVDSRGADAGSDALGLLQDLAPSASTSGSIADGGAASAMKALGRYPGPSQRSVDEFVLAEVPSHCDTDYSQACPTGFVAGASGCAPTSAYQGPCSGEVRSFDGLSDAAKARWSALCLAQWPCVECDRNFAAACPKGWSAVDGKTRSCQAPSEYVGPCADVADFDGFNGAMLSQWSTACGAFWECKKRSDAAVSMLSGSEAVVNLRLAPPADPLPQVSKLIGGLEAARHGAEAEAERSLQAAFDKAVADGRARIHQVVANAVARTVGGSVAFLAGEAVDGNGKFMLKVSPPQAPSGAVRSGIVRLDRVLASEEAALTQQACREMGLLVDIVVGMLKSEMSAASQQDRGASFLSAGDDLNVRLSASDAYPTVAELVAEMEDRRAEGEAGLRQRIAEMQLKLLQALNGFASQAFAEQK